MVRITYVSRRVEQASAERIAAWARRAGFQDVVPAEKMHVTLIYSKTPPVNILPVVENLWVPSDRNRLVGRLRDAWVLHLHSFPLHTRFAALMRAGASFDRDSYCPHITFARDEEEKGPLLLPRRGLSMPIKLLGERWVTFEKEETPAYEPVSLVEASSP